MLFDRRARQGAQSHRGVGSLRRRAGVVAGLGCAVRLDRRCRHAAHLSLRRRRRRAASAITREHSFSSLAIAGSGPVIVGLRQSFTEPPTLVSIIARTGAATKLSDFNDAALAKLTQGRVESVTYTGANGEDVQMWIVYPPNFTPDRKWPLYLLLHGGPHNGVDRRLSVALERAGVRELGLRHGLAQLPRLERLRPGVDGFDHEGMGGAAVPGHDQGGRVVSRAALDRRAIAWPQAAAATAAISPRCLLGKPHPFKTLVAHAAVYDSYTQYASDYGASKKRFGEYWEDFERFQRNSPHMNAANFNTPTLVIHGQLDLRVPVNHGLELFNTLQNRGVPSKFVYFPDENHWILKPQNSLFWYETKRKWLEQYVKPGPGARAASRSAERIARAQQRTAHWSARTSSIRLRHRGDASTHNEPT